MTTTDTLTRVRRAALLARRLAVPSLALVITAAVLLAELAYELGRQTGAAVHARAEQLAALHVALLGLNPAAGDHHQAAAEPSAAADPEPLQAAAAIATRATVAQLRTLARQQLGSAARVGGRRIAQATRAALVAALQEQGVALA